MKKNIKCYRQKYDHEKQTYFYYNNAAYHGFMQVWGDTVLKCPTQLEYSE